MASSHETVYQTVCSTMSTSSSRLQHDKKTIHRTNLIAWDSLTSKADENKDEMPTTCTHMVVNMHQLPMLVLSTRTPQSIQNTSSIVNVAAHLSVQSDALASIPQYTMKSAVRHFEARITRSIWIDIELYIETCTGSENQRKVAHCGFENNPNVQIHATRLVSYKCIACLQIRE